MSKPITFYYDHNVHQMLPMLDEIEIYVDTSAFQSNAGRHPTDPESVADLAAMRTLNGWQASGRYKLRVSNLNHQEISRTRDPTQKAKLREDHAAFGKVAKNERLLGFNVMSDQYGGFVCSPIMADVQDETIRDKLMKLGLTQEDAGHISQANAKDNEFDYFVTRDKNIIKHRDEIEKCVSVKIQTPVETVSLLKLMGRIPKGAK